MSVLVPVCDQETGVVLLALLTLAVLGGRAVKYKESFKIYVFL